MKTFVLILFFCFSLQALELEKPKQYTNQEITGWYMSEKLDGIRAYWNGKELLSKNGNKIYAPLSFTKNFPAFHLDGELWTKRNDFSNIQSIILDKTPSLSWNQVTYNIFEAPYSKGNFKIRLKKIKQWFKTNSNENVKIIKQIKTKNKMHMYKFLKQVVHLKGEGVIIKNPNLEYINKRSSNALKVAMFYDTEGKIIKINYNKKGLMKSLVLQLKNNIVFNLGSGFTKAQRIKPPKVGSFITFKYYGLTSNKKPRFASFLRVRKIE